MPPLDREETALPLLPAPPAPDGMPLAETLPAGGVLLDLDRAWQAAREAWLLSKAQRSGSRHTRRAYTTVLARVDELIALRQGRGG